MIVLPNGFNVYPEDIENALRIAGIRDAIAVETKPGRIEAIVLPGARARCRGGRGESAARPRPTRPRSAPASMRR